MTDLQIAPTGDGTWDLVLESTEFGQDFVLVGATAATWLDEVSQRVVFATMTWLGESMFDITQGFPWEEGVFGKQPIEGIVEYLYQHIESVEGVDNLDEAPVIEFDSPNRRLSISCVVRAGEFVVPVHVVIEGEQQT